MLLAYSAWTAPVSRVGGLKTIVTIISPQQPWPTCSPCLLHLPPSCNSHTLCTHFQIPGFMHIRIFTCAHTEKSGKSVPSLIELRAGVWQDIVYLSCSFLQPSSSLSLQLWQQQQGSRCLWLLSPCPSSPASSPLPRPEACTGLGKA
jgi:hypothetical protein